jgi:hypothetical protein
MRSPLMMTRPTLVPPAWCSESAGTNEPYFVARTVRYAAQYGACVVWLPASITCDDRRFSLRQLPSSHWQKPTARASDFTVPFRPDSTMA